jgi:hypothetical protein
MFLVFDIGGTSIMNNIVFATPLFDTPGAKFSGFHIFPFGSGGPSASLPNFSVLSHLKMG